MGKLILVRHGESAWNATGKLAGTADISLTESGRQQARQAAQQLVGVTIDGIYTSKLKRAIETADEIRRALDLTAILHQEAALNERSFGTYTGREKVAVIKEIGQEKYAQLIDTWDVAPPEGESLQMLDARLVPFFEATIRQRLQAGQNILIVSHHNTLRVLIKHIESIPKEALSSIKLHNAEVRVLTIN